jgi:hypothetical protein
MCGCAASSMRRVWRTTTTITSSPAAIPTTSRTYVNIEISGLPPKGSKSLTRLRGARKAYKEFFSNPQQPNMHLPGMSSDFYDPPIPVEVEGSLFFDMSHRGPGRRACTRTSRRSGKSTPSPGSCSSRRVSREDEKRTRKRAKRKRATSSRARPGLPKPESVVAEKTFVSPKGRMYRILTTTETDPYDPPVPGKNRNRDCFPSSAAAPCGWQPKEDQSMYTMIRSIPLSNLLRTQAPALFLSFVIAELFYKFHSFTLECLAFLGTWFVIDAAITAVGARFAPGALPTHGQQ